ncbi:MAG: hypothetical protein V3S41_07505, partial [Spirochaetia bacterium]
EVTAEEVVLSEEQQEVLRLEEQLQLIRGELEAQSATSAELRTRLSALQQTVVEMEVEIAVLQEQAAIAAGGHEDEIKSLKSEREALLLDLERLAGAAEIAAAQAAQALAALSETVASPSDGESSPTGSASASQAALIDALGGLGGFRRVEELGFQGDSRLASRLAVTGSGLAVDSTGEEPLLFDAGLSFDSSLVYLTITDPAGRDPGLVLTVQYVSDLRPLYAQTAFISIQGNDPIDPIDPVIFTRSPERETDGVRIREAFSREVDRQLLNRISVMLTSSGFTTTFVGTAGRESYRPTVAERAAISRVLFAYIDLGGYR